MAFCPRCRGWMAATATACPHCGYDFPPAPAPAAGGPAAVTASWLRGASILALAAALLLALSLPWVGLGAGAVLLAATGLGVAGGAGFGLAALLAALARGGSVQRRGPGRSNGPGH